MIRGFLLILSTIAVVGLGPAVAQDLFIKRDNGADKGDKPTLYLKPNITSNSSLGTPYKFKNRYKDRLRTAQLKKHNLENLKTLEAWRKSGLQPKTAEEIASYASAHRAVTQQVMYKRREALNEHFAKQDLRLARAKIVSQQAAAFKTQKTDAVKPDGSVQDAKASESKSKPKKKRIFIKRENKDDGKPKKLFNNYR